MSNFNTFFSLAKGFYSKVFALEKDSVIEVKIEDYVHYDIKWREDCLFLHSYQDNEKENFEIVLHRENQTKTAFSLYRSSDSEECQIQFIRFKDKLPILMARFPTMLNVSTLQELCRYINNNPTQNLCHISAYFGYIDFFRQLSHETDYSSINVQDENGKTPLHIAVETQRLNILQTIITLQNLFVVLKFDLADKRGNNILHYSAQTTGQIVSTLCSAIKNSTNGDLTLLTRMINTKNQNNFTPLYLACFYDKPACVKELLKNGADVNGASLSQRERPSRDDSFDLSDDRVINQLNVKDMKNGGTPLHWCRSKEVIEMLVDMDCNLDARNFHGDTALHVMVDRNDLTCTISLLSHGADVNAVGANGNTPLHVAIKANNTSLVQALIVFGANVDVLNSAGDSPRHLAATSTLSPNKDIILYVLHSISAIRCKNRRPSCTDGCAPESSYNGVPPDNPLVKNYQDLFDKTLLEHIIQGNLEKKLSSKNGSIDKKKKVKLLCLDGGGIRGLILIQILCHIETITKKRIVDMFDWIAGTSTGGILALMLASGYSASECRQIYFRLKDKIFVGFRPHCSDTLETFIKKYLGSEKKMNEISKPKLMIPATLADRFPPNVQFFRNYTSPDELLNIPFRNNIINMDTSEEYLWKVARATGAAPTYFSQFDCYIDGGLISNNPTLDLLSEIQYLNRAYDILERKNEVIQVDLVLSLGTGLIPSVPFEKLNFSSLFSLSALSSLASNFSNFQNLMKLLVEQASLANGAVVDRAQAWCSMINVPYFRINPPISEDIQMNESDNVKLVNMLWETIAYIHLNSLDMSSLITFLD